MKPEDQVQGVFNCPAVAHTAQSRVRMRAVIEPVVERELDVF